MNSHTFVDKSGVCGNRPGSQVCNNTDFTEVVTGNTVCAVTAGKLEATVTSQPQGQDPLMGSYSYYMYT